MSHFRSQHIFESRARKTFAGVNMSTAVTERIPTNMRQLLVLEALVSRVEPVTPADLAREVGLSKQTVHRLCMGLLSEGFLMREDAGGRLRPGRRARELASGLLYYSATHVARRQVLERLAEDLKETVNFVVPGDSGMAYHDRVESSWPFQIQLPIGTTVPFHCTASGKAFLASLGRAEQRRLVGVMTLTRQTPNTITSSDEFLAELRRTTKRGYSIDNEEFYEGMIAVAVPVKSQSGRYLASLAIHAPTQRMSLDDAMAKAGAVSDAAQQLSEILS